jgi:S-adenosylmethionine:tRNA ribosyltransferase-isomerase
MNVAEFDFELPPDRIAQEPADRRDGSRLMVLERASGVVAHRRFTDLPEELRAGDLLVLNDAKVLPLRLRGTKPTGGRVEILLVEPVGEDAGAPVWRALLTGSKSLRPGLEIVVVPELRVVPLAREDDVWRVKLVLASGDTAAAMIEAVGEMPLPPYIHRKERDPRRPLDRERYQTVYARVPGAVAAPTAGLHFTPELLASVAARGVDTAFVTLHVGLGTFSPVRASVVEDHRMHAETFVVPEAAADAVRRARARGGRIVAVGTTVARVLESCADDRGCCVPGSGQSALFIYPGHRFNVVDALVTNFHLPRSTLLMLVCAFAGTAEVLGAYRLAVRERYRFFSYGDAMLVKAA